MMKTAAKVGPHRSANVPKAPPLDLSTVSPPFAPPSPDLGIRANRLFGLRTAPTFRPTLDEFADPLRYIEKIRVEAEQSGICKIIPPEGWKPDFALDTQTFWFRPRIMRLNSMEGSSRAILNYLDQLQKFHHQQGTQFQRIPMLDKKPMNLFELKKEVAKRGGFHAVTQNKQWAQVGRAIGLGGKTCTSLSHSVKSAYIKWVLPYEDFIAKHGSPAVTRPGSPLGDDTGGLDDAPTSGTRSKRAQRAKKRKSAEVVPEIPTADSSPSAKKAILPDGYLPKPGLELCEICGGGENDEKMLLCDGCNRGYHLYCFDPPMSAIPNTDWFCPDCLRVSGNDYGFEEGEVRSLYHFQKVANSFKERHFRERLGKKMDEKLIVTEDECEREFWRLVESPYDDVEVEYGADLHSTQHGSGFPVPEKQPNNPYSTCGWNLNNIPVLPESLFCNIRNDISGMMIPWLYVGMCFSTFCWHTEDHYTYSINYHHWGETKTWYGIPASDAAKFEDAMRKKVPELFESNPDLLFHLTTMLSPGVLVEKGVDVVALDQRPGEFVVTFPRAYHAGFNQGFNFAEAVNFALPNWLPFGLDCVERYHEYRKQPVFSHDELVIATSKRDIDVRAAVWLKPELEHLRDHELEARKQIRELHPGIHEVVENLEIAHEEEDQCAVCKCENPDLTLALRFSDEQLIGFLEHVNAVANRPNEWKEKYEKLLAQHRRPPLKELQRLSAASEKIPFVIEEATLLKNFVRRANEWVERANRILHKRKRSNAGRRSIVDTMDLESSEQSTDSKGHAQPASERTLANIEQLLRDAETFTFDCPEIKLLQALAHDVYEFREKARQVLADANVTAQMVRDTQEWAATLDVQIEELDLLEDKLSELEWGTRADAALSREGSDIDHDRVVSLIDEGRMFGVKTDHPLMSRLKTFKHQGDEWRVLAAALLKQRSMTLEDMKDVLKKGNDVPVIADMWKKLTDLVARCEDWRAKARDVLGLKEDGSRDESTNMSGKTKWPVSVLWSLLFDIDNIPVRLEELTLIKEDAKKAQDWLNKGRKVLRTGSARSFLDITKEMEANVINCTSSEADAKLFCICRTKIDEGLMIECETCHVWYHSACVKISKKQAKRQTHYMCPVCDVWTEPNRTAKRPTIDQIKGLLKEAEEMERYEFEEVPHLRSVIQAMDAWQDRVRSVLTAPASETDAKNLLRCAEGMYVSTEEETTILRERIKEICPPPPPPSVPVDAELAMKREDEVFCVCREPHREDDGDMIGCDDCGGWYHFKCVGLTAADAEKMETYTCPMCQNKAAQLGRDKENGVDAASNGAPLKITLKLGHGSVRTSDEHQVKKKRKKSSAGDESAPEGANFAKVKRRKSAGSEEPGAEHAVRKKHKRHSEPKQEAGPVDIRKDNGIIATDGARPAIGQNGMIMTSATTPDGKGSQKKRKKDAGQTGDVTPYATSATKKQRVEVGQTSWAPTVSSLITAVDIPVSLTGYGRMPTNEEALPPAPPDLVPSVPSSPHNRNALPSASLATDTTASALPSAPPADANANPHILQQHQPPLPQAPPQYWYPTADGQHHLQQQHNQPAQSAMGAYGSYPANYYWQNAYGFSHQQQHQQHHQQSTPSVDEYGYGFTFGMPGSQAPGMQSYPFPSSYEQEQHHESANHEAHPQVYR
ncbi:hypothetical protein SpCBS45565_g01901 [Spizellomyces sp. 'palustris']|nr:hypothetical protein SpCBS45565_g01901 [Spizellomyces sp. 'palustris']